jgi:hypothetical protein
MLAHVVSRSDIEQAVPSAVLRSIEVLYILCLYATVRFSHWSHNCH